MNQSMNESMTKVGIELLGQLKSPFCAGWIDNFRTVNNSERDVDLEPSV